MKNKKIKRPWGSYTVLSKGKDYKVKLIEVKPNCRLSLQSHNHRTEHWTVVEGYGYAMINNVLYACFSNVALQIAATSKHRLVNKSKKVFLKIIEVQCGKCYENDITRYEDDYGRVK